MKKLIVLIASLGFLTSGIASANDCRLFKGKTFCVDEVVGLVGPDWMPMKKRAYILEFGKAYKTNGDVTVAFLGTQKELKTKVNKLIKREDKKYLRYRAGRRKNANRGLGFEQ